VRRFAALTVDIVDDGVGVGSNARRSGMHILRTRARPRGSDATRARADPGSDDRHPGTIVRWSALLGAGS
jgi:signal transduction histidine kinase